MPIPLVDLKAQYRTIKPEVDAAIAAVVESCGFIMGKEMYAFEEEFARYCGVKHGVAVSNGSDALHLALQAGGIGPGDEVITVPNTFVATTEAITRVGASIKFVDIDVRQFNMDPALLEKAITRKTKALLPVHLYGQIADMDPIMDVARRHGLLVVEDAAQAHGATYKGKRGGAWGQTACFSFYPGKNLGAYGDAGMVVTDDDAVAEKLRLLRDHGQDRSRKYTHTIEGYCFRMDAIQAAVLRVKLRHLDDWNAARRRHAATYAELFKGTDVIPPYVLPGSEHVYHIYGARMPKRDAVMAALKAKGIDARVHYPIPVHLQPAYARLGHKAGDFPATEQAVAEVISLPIYAEMTRAQIEEVVGTVKDALRAG
jgi:dTDP-4-amino-4,6-dideoxygalactose transaminase